ncbi:MAG: FUSC family protein [Leucobacter sp.]
MTHSSLFGDLIRFHPRQGEWTVAARATLSAVIPLLVLFSVNRLDWALFAAFTAMSSLFGRNQPLLPRLRMQFEAGVSLIVATMVGVGVGLSPHRTWLAIPVIAVFATFMAVVAHKRNWHPGGVIFQVFAVGALSSAARTLSDFTPAITISVATLILVLILTYLTSMLRHLWRRNISRQPHEWIGAKARPEALPGHGPEWPWHHYVVRYGLGIVVAGVIATAIGIGHPYWAMVSVTVPLAAATSSGRSLRGVQRVFGTLAGVLVTWVVLSFAPSPIALIIVIGIAQAGAELFVGRNYGFALLFITPLALCMVQLGHPVPVGELIADRAIETVLGVAVGLSITLLTHERKQRGDTD